MTEIKQYTERDAMELDEVGGYYFRHVLAMTAEGLHSKSDIAAELGWRDMQIAALQEQVRALAAEVERFKDDYRNNPVLKRMGYPTTPATDAFIREIRAQARAEGIHFAANRLLAAWESGFVDDTPAVAHDISGAILSAVEFLPNAFEAEFKRDYADEVRARIRAGEQP